MNIVEALHKVKNDLLDFITTNLKNKADATHTHIASEVGADEKGSAANALESAQSYTDTKIADLINSAPTTLDTLGEIAAAMADNDNVVAALEASIGNKANASDLEAMQTQVSDLETKVGDTEVSTQITNAIAENNKNYYTASDVDDKFEALGDIGSGNADEVQADLDAYKTTNDAAVQAAQATADAAVVANQLIVGGTYTKITYDSKGLVTGGADLSAEDIPEIGINQVTNLQDALDAKQNNLVFNTEYHESTNKVATMSDVAKVSDLVGDKTVSEQITEAVTSKADAEHDHDDKYYTESEIDSQMANKSDVGHTHDDLYYTETEIDTKLATKVDIVEGSRLITESEASKLESLVVGDSGQIEISGKVNANNVEGLDDLLALKVDKVDGMGLSTNDYSNEEKQKLADVIGLVGDTKVSEQITTAIADKADIGHTHDNYALTEHTHDEYATTSHTHDTYALKEHEHTEYAVVEHDHSEYALTTHKHDYSELENAPTALPANGGDADTVDGKHASEFALASEFATVVSYVGDKKVSEQIEEAIADKADNSHNHDDVYYTESEMDSKLSGKSDTDHNHDDMYYTESEVDTKLANKVDVVAGSRLITTSEAEKLDALVLGDSGNLELSGKVNASNVDGLDELLATKVDVVDGMGLSTNDYTDDEKAKLAKVADYVGDESVSAQIENAIVNKADVGHTHSEYALVEHTHDGYALSEHEHTGYATETYVAEQVGAKVDKVEGMGLSTNDYTTDEKTKLSGIEDGANKTVVDEALNAESVNPVQNKAVQVAISEIMTLIGDKSVSEQIQDAMSSLTNLEEVYF